jgi:hypothetical protein
MLDDVSAALALWHWEDLPLTPEVEAMVLELDPDSELGRYHQGLLARDPRASLEAQETLLGRNWHHALASNRGVHPQVQEVLLLDDTASGAFLAARNPALTPETQEELAKLKGPLWLAVLVNPALVPGLRALGFEGLSPQGCSFVCACESLAARGDLSDEEVELLLKHDQAVMNLSTNKALTDTQRGWVLLRALERELHYCVDLLGPRLTRDQAQHLLSRTETRWHDAAASSVHLGEEDQLDLLERKVGLLGLAQNEAISHTVAQALVHERNAWRLCQRLAQNPGAPVDVLAGVRDEELRDQALETSSAPAGVVEHWVREDPALLRHALDYPGLELTTSTPAEMVGPRLLGALLGLASEQGADLATVLELRRGWEGSIGDLLTTAVEVGPAAKPA